MGVRDGGSRLQRARKRMARRATGFLCAVVDPVKQEGQQKKVSVSLRGDGEAGSETVGLVIKMQARFKPRLQQNKETKAMEKISKKALEQVVGEEARRR